MMRDAMTGVVSVHVRMHPDAVLPKHLVVFRAGEGRQEKQFQNIDMQLALDDLNVTKNRFLGVGGKAYNIARMGDGAVIAPLLQQLPVFGDLILPFLGSDQIVGIDVLQPDKDMARSRLRGLLDEIRNLVTERVDLDREDEIRILDLA